MRHTVVERELELKLVLSPERSIPVPAKLRYRSDDPYAVHITFHVNSDRPVHWTFARELLVEGVFRPCGHGDVRVWPTKASGRGLALGLALLDEHGTAPDRAGCDTGRAGAGEDIEHGPAAGHRVLDEGLEDAGRLLGLVDRSPLH